MTQSILAIRTLLSIASPLGLRAVSAGRTSSAGGRPVGPASGTGVAGPRGLLLQRSPDAGHELVPIPLQAVEIVSEGPTEGGDGTARRGAPGRRAHRYHRPRRGRPRGCAAGPGTSGTPRDAGSAGNTPAPRPARTGRGCSRGRSPRPAPDAPASALGWILRQSGSRRSLARLIPAHRPPRINSNCAANPSFSQ